MTMTADYHRDDTDAQHTEPTRLAGREALATLRESGGYVILRYDTGDSHIDYRWNPARNTYEQLSVILDGPIGSTLDGYYELSDATAAALLTDPPGGDITPPQVVRFTDSHYPGVNQSPDTLDLPSTHRNGNGDGTDEDEDA